MDKNENRRVSSPLQSPGGLRRSTRGQNRPPPSEAGTDDPRKEVGDVKVSVQGGSKKIKVDLAGRDGSLEGGGPARQPRQENGRPQSKVDGTIRKLGKGPVSPPGVITRSAAARRRSEARSFAASPEEQAAHPCLFIENILDEVFKHVVNQSGPRKVMTADVRSIRLVCKTWTTSITRLYRQTCPATLFFRCDQNASNFPFGRKSLTQFMKTMSSSQMIPVQNYTFDVGVFHRQNLKMFREFLLLCGPDVVVLSMTFMTRDTKDIMLNLNPDNLSSLEMNKLKQLKLFIFENQRRPHKSADAGLLKLIKFLLIAAKTLQDLKINYQHSCSDPYKIHEDLIVQKLCLVLAKRMATTVKKLELMVRMSEAAFNNLAEMQATLESLELWRVSVLEGRSMYKFLQSQATTLKDVKLWSSYDNNSSLVVEFPRLDELVNLQLPDSTVSVTAPSHFAETFPKLHSLKVSTGNAISTLLSTVKKPSGTLKVLVLETWRFTYPPPLIKMVAQSFPYLAELRIGIHLEHKETLEEVFKYLDSLESLHISFYVQSHLNVDLMDSLFSGIPEAECNRIRGLQDFGTVSVNELRRQPSIVNLQKLKKLNIECHPSYWVAFTDLSAYFGFIEMEHLREINLPNGVVKFSSRYLDLLRDKLILRRGRN